ncbi:hypothetical protein D4764_16G0005420 [Takifugu flavidus]|uniref:Uncharacterized protein n=1 Tax=Takifugu flavidus TaxID=433684 RepID=A0A5C6NYE0_9TELE|nr:hypothetical protein D4764_16G0005420 [Takifugu flavidus]
MLNFNKNGILSGAVAAPGSRGRCCPSDAPLRLKRSSRRNKWRLSSAQQLICDRAQQQEPLRGKHTASGFLRSEDELHISRRTSPGRGALAEVGGEGGGPTPAVEQKHPPSRGRRWSSVFVFHRGPIICAVGDRSSRLPAPPDRLAAASLIQFGRSSAQPSPGFHHQHGVIPPARRICAVRWLLRAVALFPPCVASELETSRVFRADGSSEPSGVTS